MAATEPTRRTLPIILVRGFGGLNVEDEKKIAYQGFNDGTVYHAKRGENYIYEGMFLRFLKSRWDYEDATNVVGYYGDRVSTAQDIPTELVNAGFELEHFLGDGLVLDPGMALAFLDRSRRDPTYAARSLWVFRYYDLNDRTFARYGQALVRLIDIVGKLTETTDADGSKRPGRVNLIAHSMGGLIVRHAAQVTYPKQGRRAEDHVNKIVTLGTPHRGISFQVVRDWAGIVGAENELEAFNPKAQEDAAANPDSYRNFALHFPVERLLTVVGTNYRTYAIGISSALNRLFSFSGEFGPNYNRSDGLVKQTSAQVPGAPRTFVHKCHGGFDSLVTSRESYEIAARYFFGNTYVRLRLVDGVVTRGKDLFGKSEYFLGVSIKPRRVDFDLFHQSPEAENTYGPFSRANDRKHVDFGESSDELAFPWADENRLIWEGWLDTRSILDDPRKVVKDLVLRLDFYVGERDLFGFGFSDNVIFRKQYYVRALLKPQIELYLHTDEAFAEQGYDLGAHLADAARALSDSGGAASPPVERMPPAPAGTAYARSSEPAGAGAVINAARFAVKGTGFEGTFQIEVFEVNEDGDPRPHPVA